MFVPKKRVKIVARLRLNNEIERRIVIEYSEIDVGITFNFAALWLKQEIINGCKHT